jgi:NitT/TauT family transport system ATP-binding protein
MVRHTQDSERSPRTAEAVAEAAGGDLLVTASGAGFAYPGDILAVRDLSLDLRKGELVSVVGPSGCGKSTLLKLIAGLLVPDEGELQVAGRTPVQARRDLHTTSFVFQSPTLLSWRTVAGNVALPLELEGVPLRDRRPAVDEALVLVGLADFQDRYPPQLSGGMQMRASVARALVTRPDVLLLDEPFGSLDEITRQRLNEELGSLHAAQRWSGVFVTHNVFEAVFLASRVLVMSNRPGRIVAEVPIDLGWPRPASLRTEPAFVELARRVSEHLREVA